MPDEVRHPRFARLYARFAPMEDRAGADAYRRELVAGLRGRVLEVGAGTGLSFRHYPATVTELLAVEPEPTMREHAAAAAREATVAVRLVDGTADALPAEDASVDAAVVSQVLCSVPEQARALAELRRVLRPGGELRFYEHVVSPHAGVRALQHALDATVWPRMMGGCRLTRATARAMEEAGFAVRDLRHVRVMISPATPHILGVATAPA